MKKILYLSFYFEPDLCAGSFRNSPLVRELARQVTGKAEVHVISTLPNRYNSFSADAPQVEHIDNLCLHRVELPMHKSGFKDQIFAFWHYFMSVKKLTRHQQYDLVFASSSRLFTAYLGYTISRKKKIPLYLDIRDIFTDTLNDVIPNRLIKSSLLPFLRWIERRTFRSAKHINLISEGFKEYFQQYRGPAYSFFTNGIDPEFIQEQHLPEKAQAGNPVTITYAGNIGEGQGLHKIIPQAAKILGSGYLFRVVGDGGARHLLETTIQQMQVTNVHIENPVKRKELLRIYGESDYLFMHLNDYKAFEKVLPSKVFELGAFPRPIIAGVNGYAREFIMKNIPDAILIPPANYDAFVTAIRKYNFQYIYRSEFVDKYSRSKINSDMAKSIQQYL